MREGQESFGTLSRNTLVVISLLVGGVMLAHLTGVSAAWGYAMITALTEGVLAAVIVVSACGYAYPLVRRLAPKSAPKPLVVITACAAGLWLFSVAVLIFGSVEGKLLRGWVWWPVIVVGVVLAVWRGRRFIETISFPERTDGRGLLWVIIAVAAAMLLAGATLPPGFIGSPWDAREVLLHHLQCPREYYNAGQVAGLEHNCYSYMPQGTEMLCLLAMVLRGGAYEGMYLAKMLHAAMAVGAVAAVFAVLKHEGQETRSRFSAGLLATAPFAIYLGWVAVGQLAELCCLTLALLWLRQWLHKGEDRAALCIGLMIGAACSTSYYSAIFVAAPVLAVMLIAGFWKPRRFVQFGLTLVAAAVLVSPHLVRNAIKTGNPVFPLAADTLGRGHWAEQSQHRWAAANGRELSPPVPTPDGWEIPRKFTAVEKFYYHFLASQWFGQMVMIIAAVTLCAMIADTRPSDPWDWALGGVIAVQLGLWVAKAGQMLPGHVASSVVPIALLAGGGLARLAGVQVNPFRRGSLRPARGPWGLMPAVGIFVVAVGVNLLVVYGIYRATVAYPVHGMAGSEVAGKVRFWKDAADLGEEARILLVGADQAFYFPPDAIYSTPFDAEGLVAKFDEGLDGLRRRGITHLWVGWPEIVGLAGTVGYPDPIGPQTYQRRIEKKQPKLAVFDGFLAEGMEVLKTLQQPQPTPATRTASQPTTRPTDWPIVTIYLVSPPETADDTGQEE